MSNNKPQPPAWNGNESNWIARCGIDVASTMERVHFIDSKYPAAHHWSEQKAAQDERIMDKLRAMDDTVAQRLMGDIAATQAPAIDMTANLQYDRAGGYDEMMRLHRTVNEMLAKGVPCVVITAFGDFEEGEG